MKMFFHINMLLKIEFKYSWFFYLAASICFKCRAENEIFIRTIEIYLCKMINRRGCLFHFNFKLLFSRFTANGFIIHIFRV